MKRIALALILTVSAASTVVMLAPAAQAKAFTVDPAAGDTPDAAAIAGHLAGPTIYDFLASLDGGRG